MFHKSWLISLLCLSVFLSASAPGQTQSSNAAVQKANARDFLHAMLSSGPKEITVFSPHPELKLRLYEDTNKDSPHYGLKLCWLLLPSAFIRMTVSDVRKSGESSVIYAELSQKSDVVISNGGFFGYGAGNSYLPVGLVIVNGRISSAQAKWSSGGAIIQSKGSLKVVSVAALHAIGPVEQAIQSKPMLVERGKSGIKSDPMPPFNRVCVGMDKEGNIIVAGAFQEDGAALTLVEFSAFLSATRAEGGPEAMYALNLDGGPDAHLYFPAIGLHLGYGGQNFVPNGIRFYWK